MTGSTFLNQIGLGGFDLGYLLIGMTVTILLHSQTDHCGERQG